MNDEWRLQIDLGEVVHARMLTRRLDAHRLHCDLSKAFHDRVIVTRNGDVVFLYAGTIEQVEKARDLIETEARRNQWAVDIDLSRWHPIAEEWENPDEALPSHDDSRRVEREELMAREREDAAKKGYPEFEVRVDLSSHREAARLSEQLSQEGIPTVRRWKYLLVGATDEDSAKALAERIRDEASFDSRVTVEGTLAAVRAVRPGPFAVLSGLRD